MATLLWLDGFEHGTAASGAAGVYDTVTGTPATVTTPVRTGLRSMEISASAAAEFVRYTLAAGNRIVTMAFYVRFASLPAADAQLAHWVGTTNGYIYYHQSTGKFAVRDTTTGTFVDDTTTVATNTWYRIACEFDTSTGTYAIRMKVDANTEVQTTAAHTAADITSVNIGCSSAQTWTGYFDDWLVSVTDGDYEEIRDWTSHQIESLIPNSDGSHNITTAGDFDSFTGTAFDNTTTNGNTFIAHRPLQVANTADQVIRQELGTTANYMEFGLENLADNTKAVAGVRAYATHVDAASAGASFAEARLLLSDNTEVLTTGSLSVINSSEDANLIVTIRKRMTIAPSGGWDGTKVDGSKARVGFADNAPDTNFIDFMIEVAQFVAPVVAFPLFIVPDMAIYPGPSDA